MKGFFNLPQQSKETKGRILACSSCGLYQSVLFPKMQAFGNFRKEILNIGEAPGESEDKKGKQWQGKVGRLLKDTYESLGIDLFEDCLNINAINCRPTDKKGANRPPSPHEVACCRRRVLKVIEQHKPKIIMILGGQALLSIMGHRWNKDLGGIMKWRGWTIPDRDFNAWICPTFHPSFIARSGGKSNIPGKFKPPTIEAITIWKQDLKQAMQLIDRPIPEYQNEEKYVQIIDDLSIFDSIDKKSWVTIDYETTGLKPHAKGHKIICASVAINDKDCYAFMMPEDSKKRRPFIKLLRNKDISKVAHNMKFEQAWSQVYLKTSVQGGKWDTMLAAHVLDNRPGITSLKFQTYVNFGRMGYDDNISSYLKGTDKKNSNAHNRITELLEKPNGKEELLIYCGLDSIFAYKLAEKQGVIT